MLTIEAAKVEKNTIYIPVPDATTACNPISIKIGFRISAVPIPKNPEANPDKNAIISNLVTPLRSILRSPATKVYLALTLREYSLA